MNDKFFDLPESKQQQIINAAYKVFSLSNYPKAPTSEIAREAQISKSLLFHYFHNKQELYIYLWDKANEITGEAKIKYMVYDTDDYFESLRRGLHAKCELMRKYTYLSLFSINAYFEDEPDIRQIIHAKVKAASDEAYNSLLKNVGDNYFRQDVSVERIFKEILYASEGLMYGWYRKDNLDVDQFEKEYMEMIDHWERIYRK